MSSEQLTEMLVICAQGILTVFAILIILWGVIVIMHKCLMLSERKAKKQEKAAVPQPAAESVAAPAPAVSETDDDELIAVLTAAVAASLNTSTYNLRIKSFRRIVQNAPAWNAAARKEQIENQL